MDVVPILTPCIGNIALYTTICGGPTKRFRITDRLRWLAETSSPGIFAPAHHPRCAGPYCW